MIAPVSQEEHKKLAIGYFEAAWELIDLPQRTDMQNQDMLTLAFASRQHWLDARGTMQNQMISDWQVSHVASLLDISAIAIPYAESAVRMSDGEGIPTWLKASAHEGLARAYACAGYEDEYRDEAAKTRKLLEGVEVKEDRDLIEGQLQSIDTP